MADGYVVNGSWAPMTGSLYMTPPYDACCSCCSCTFCVPAPCCHSLLPASEPVSSLLFFPPVAAVIRSFPSPASFPQTPCPFWLDKIVSTVCTVLEPSYPVTPPNPAAASYQMILLSASHDTTDIRHPTSGIRQRRHHEPYCPMYQRVCLIVPLSSLPLFCISFIATLINSTSE